MEEDQGGGDKNDIRRLRDKIRKDHKCHAGAHGEKAVILFPVPEIKKTNGGNNYSGYKPPDGKPRKDPGGTFGRQLSKIVLGYRVHV